MVERGGRQDVFLGTRDCQGYVEACGFGSGESFHDNAGELGFGVMFHGFDYPDETGTNELYARFWRPTMVNGVIKFAKPEQCSSRKLVRTMTPKNFNDKNMRNVEAEALDWEV
jgi:CRISPR-associated protein Cas5d